MDSGPQSESSNIRIFKVLYSFEAEGAEEMSVVKGDLLFGLLEDYNSVDDWALVSINRGGAVEKGFVPKEYLQDISGDQAVAVTSSSSNGRSSSNITSSRSTSSSNIGSSNSIINSINNVSSSNNISSAVANVNSYGTRNGSISSGGDLGEDHNDNYNNYNDNDNYNSTSRNNNFNYSSNNASNPITNTEFNRGFNQTNNYAYEDEEDEEEDDESEEDDASQSTDDSSTDVNEFNNFDSYNTRYPNQDYHTYGPSDSDVSRQRLEISELGAESMRQQYQEQLYQQQQLQQQQLQQQYQQHQQLPLPSSRHSSDSKVVMSLEALNLNISANRDLYRDRQDAFDNQRTRASPLGQHAQSVNSHYRSGSNNNFNGSSSSNLIDNPNYLHSNSNIATPNSMSASRSSSAHRYSVNNDELRANSYQAASSTPIQQRDRATSGSSRSQGFRDSDAFLSTSGSFSKNASNLNSNVGSNAVLQQINSTLETIRSPSVRTSTSTFDIGNAASLNRSGSFTSGANVLASASKLLSSSKGFSSNGDFSNTVNDEGFDSSSLGLDKALVSSLATGNFDDLIQKNEEFFAKVLSSQLETFQSVSEISGNLSKKLSETSKECQDLVDDLSKLDEYIDDQRRRLKQQNEYEKNADILAKARDITKFN